MCDNKSSISASEHAGLVYYVIKRTHRFPSSQWSRIFVYTVLYGLPWSTSGECMYVGTHYLVKLKTDDTLYYDTYSH